MKKKIITYFGVFILVITSLFPAASVFAQGTINADIDISPINTTTLSGQNALYRMDFKVTGVNTTYSNSKLTVSVPKGFLLDVDNMPLESIAINGVTPVYDTTNNTLIYELGNLHSGINYSEILKVKTTNGSTLNDTELTLHATFTADNFEGDASDDATVKVEASNTISTSKTAKEVTDAEGKKITRPPGTNDIINWEMKVSDINKKTGLLYLKEGSNIVVEDTIPKGLTYVSDDSGGVYDSKSNTVTWTYAAPSLDEQKAATESLFSKTINVKTKITSTTNFDNFTNMVKATATDLNGNAVTNSSSAKISMGVSDPTEPVVPSGNIYAVRHGANASAGFYKNPDYKENSNPDPTLYNDQTWATGFNITVNQANSRAKDLTSYEVNYSIDSHLNLSSLYTPGYRLAYDNALHPDTPLVGAYHPNMDIYITVNGKEYKAVTNASDGSLYQMSTIFKQYGLPEDSHVTNIRYHYNFAPAGMYLSNMGVNFTIQKDYVGKVTNKVVYKLSGYNADDKKVDVDTTSVSTNPSEESGQRTAEIVKRPEASPPVATSQIGLDLNENGVVNGGSNRVTGNFANATSSTSLMHGPFSSVILLPKGLTVNTDNPEYQLTRADGQWDSKTTDGNNTYGSLKIISNDYNGSGRQQILVNWTYTDVLSPGQSLYYSFNVNVDADVASSPMQLYTYGSSSDTDLTVPTEPSKITDSFIGTDDGSDDIANTVDINGDGSTDDKLVKSGNEYTVLKNYGIVTQKQVKGNLDTDYSDFGHVTPGGDISYKVDVTTRNPHQALTNFVFVDVLPTVGDLGITDNVARNSKFTPILSGPVVVPDSWKLHVQIYYSTSKNPKRGDLTEHVSYPETTTQMTDPEGAEDPAWQTADQVTDWSQIHSFMIKQNEGDIWSGLKNLLRTTVNLKAPTVEQLKAAGELGALATNVSGDPTTGEKERAAWNSFAYQENFSQVVEPVKVGVAMENYTGDIYLLKFEGGTTEDTDNDGKPDIDPDYHLTKGNALAGAEFDLIDSDGKVVGHATTDKEGQIHFSNVWYGDYTLVETKAPEGYELLKEPLHVTVSKANDGVAVAFAADNKQTVLPKTGSDHPSQMPIIIASSLSLVGLLALGGKFLFDSKRKRKGGE